MGGCDRPGTDRRRAGVPRRGARRGRYGGAPAGPQAARDPRRLRCARRGGFGARGVRARPPRPGARRRTAPKGPAARRLGAGEPRARPRAEHPARARVGEDDAQPRRHGAARDRAGAARRAWRLPRYDRGSGVGLAGRGHSARGRFRARRRKLRCCRCRRSHGEPPRCRHGKATRDPDRPLPSGAHRRLQPEGRRRRDRSRRRHRTAVERRDRQAAAHAARPRGAVLATKFDAAGGRLATLGTDRAVRVWDVRSGRELQELAGVHKRTDVQDAWSEGVEFVGDDRVAISPWAAGLHSHRSSRGSSTPPPETRSASSSTRAGTPGRERSPSAPTARCWLPVTARSIRNSASTGCRAASCSTWSRRTRPAHRHRVQPRRQAPRNLRRRRSGEGVGDPERQAPRAPRAAEQAEPGDDRVLLRGRNEARNGRPDIEGGAGLGRLGGRAGRGHDAARTGVGADTSGRRVHARRRPARRELGPGGNRPRLEREDRG